MRDYLDFKPVPDAPLDRLLLDFKFRRILPYIKRGAVLDVGCGIGRMTESIHNAGFYVTGVDGSLARISEARVRVPSVEFIHSLFEDYKPKHLFATVVLSSVLEHVDEPVELLKMCRGWLDGGGVLIAAVPNRNALHKLVGRAMGFTTSFTSNDVMVGHVNTYNLTELWVQLLEAGFRIAADGGVCVKPLPNAMLSAIPTEVLEGYFKASANPKLKNLCSVVYAVGVKE